MASEAHRALSAPPQHPRTRRRRFAGPRAITALMLREMATTYGRTPGGYLWAIIEPVAAIAVLTFAFSFLFAVPPVGTSFELFYATGMMPFMMFTTIANRVSSALVFSKPLLSYPAVTYVDAIVARFIVNLLTELLVFYIVITGILLLYDTRAVVNFGPIAESLALASLFGLGVGTFNAYLFLRWHTWHMIWSVISRPLFVISGVFFTYGAMPHGMQTALWYNPLIHVVGTMRAGFYPGYNMDYVDPIYVVGVSLLLIVLGLRMMHWQVKTLLHER